MSEKTDSMNTGGFELVLTKSPMTGNQEQKVEQKATVATPPQPVQNPAKQAPPVAPPGFEHIANIPVIFCADRTVAKGLLVDLFAMIGTLNAIEVGNVNTETLPLVLQNAQKILTNLSDVMIRDCGVTDEDLNSVMDVFKSVNEESAQKVTVEQPKKEPTKAPMKASVGSNVL